MATPRSEYPSRKLWDESVRGKGNLGRKPICATCVTAPSARGILKLILARCRVLTCVRPHDAARSMPQGPYGVRRSGPDQSRVLKGTLLHTGSPDPVSRLLRQTAPCPLPLRRPRDRRLLTLPRPETGIRHRGPSKPRRSAPSCSPARHAPASTACATACSPAMCRVELHDGRGA